MTYIQLTIVATETEQEILISQLALFDASGFEQQSSQLIACFNGDTFDEEGVHGVLKKFVYNRETIEEQNWNATWEASFEPVIVADFCAVRAHFHPAVAHVKHEIIITPKMSFGTGHHATTFMMLTQMEALHFRGKTVFDFGTGTGVLAILAEKCGAASVTAIDNDVWSIENVAENLALNNCKKIDAYLSDVIPKNKTYDVILANITKNILLAYMGILKSCLAANGALVLSGLLEDDLIEVKQAYESTGLKLVRTLTQGNWISLLFRHAN